MLSILSKRLRVTSLTDRDFMLAFTNHWFKYAIILISLIPEDILKFLITDEIFQLVMRHGDTVLLMSLFEKSSQSFQQSIVEELLDHLVSINDFNSFVNVLNTEIVNPEFFPNGETLLTNLLKEKNSKYCRAMINSAPNKRYIVMENNRGETPLQIAIEKELFDLIDAMIWNCEEHLNPEFNWHEPLVPLFQKLSVMTNTVFIDYFMSKFID